MGMNMDEIDMKRRIGEVPLDVYKAIWEEGIYDGRCVAFHESLLALKTTETVPHDVEGIETAIVMLEAMLKKLEATDGDK